MESQEPKEIQSKVTFDGRMQYFHEIGKILGDIRETNILSNSNVQLKQLSLYNDMVQFIFNENTKEKIRNKITIIQNKIRQTNRPDLPYYIKQHYKIKIEEDISELRSMLFDESKELLTAVKRGDDEFNLDDFTKGSDI